MWILLVFIKLDVLWAFQGCGLLSVIDFGKFSAFITSNIFFSFLSCYSHYASVTPFAVVPHSWIFSFGFFSSRSFLSFCISFWEVFVYISSSSLTVSSATPSLPMSRSKAFFISVTICFYSFLSFFWFFLLPRDFIPLHYWFIRFHTSYIYIFSYFYYQAVSNLQKNSEYNTESFFPWAIRR